MVNLEYEMTLINKALLTSTKQNRDLIAKLKNSKSDGTKVDIIRLGVDLPDRSSIMYVKGNKKSQVLWIVNYRIKSNPKLITGMVKTANGVIIKLDGTWTEISDVLKSDIEKSTKGLIYFDIPPQMVVGEKERVGAIIIKEYLADAKKFDIKHSKKIKITNIMKIRLIGDDFQIVPLSNEEQVIINTGETRWNWDIVPLESSTQSLLFSISSKIIMPNKMEGMRDYPPIEKNVSVKINPKYMVLQTIRGSWQWIITTLVALFGIIFGSGIVGWLIGKRNAP